MSRISNTQNQSEFTTNPGLTSINIDEHVDHNDTVQQDLNQTYDPQTNTNPAAATVTNDRDTVIQIQNQTENINQYLNDNLNTKSVILNPGPAPATDTVVNTNSQEPKLQVSNTSSTKDVKGIQQYLKLHCQDTPIFIHRLDKTKSKSSISKSKKNYYVVGLNDGTIYRLTRPKANIFKGAFKRVGIVSSKNDEVPKFHGKIEKTGKEVLSELQAEQQKKLNQIQNQKQNLSPDQNVNHCQKTKNINDATVTASSSKTTNNNQSQNFNQNQIKIKTKSYSRRRSYDYDDYYGGYGYGGFGYPYYGYGLGLGLYRPWGFGYGLGLGYGLGYGFGRGCW